MKRKIPYLPKERDQDEVTPKKVISRSEKDYTLLPDPNVDPIVSNNIAYNEFDYTDKNSDYDF